ncbi:hypothetical protein BC940DRAFT_341764, partial [Gongronella butleri]
MDPDDIDLDEASLVASVKDLRQQCQQIVDYCDAREQEKPLEGMYRFRQSLVAEAHFFDRLLASPSTIKPNYIKSTNLGYLEAVHEAMMQ